MGNAPTRHVREVRLDLGEDWFEIVFDESDGIEWATDVVASLLKGGPEAVELALNLVDLRQNVIDSGVPEVTAVAYIPHPESGSASGLCVFNALPSDPDETIDDYYAGFESDLDTVTDAGGRTLRVEAWRGRIELGEYVAARHVIDTPEVSDPQGYLEERVVYYVFPDGADRVVQVFFIGENLLSLGHMPQNTLAWVSTMTIDSEAIGV